MAITSTSSSGAEPDRPSTPPAAAGRNVRNAFHRLRQAIDEHERQEQSGKRRGSPNILREMHHLGQQQLDHPVAMAAVLRQFGQDDEAENILRLVAMASMHPSLGLERAVPRGAPGMPGQGPAGLPPGLSREQLAALLAQRQQERGGPVQGGARQGSPPISREQLAALLARLQQGQGGTVYGEPRQGPPPISREQLAALLARLQQEQGGPVQGGARQGPPPISREQLAALLARLQQGQSPAPASQPMPGQSRWPG